MQNVYYMINYLLTQFSGNKATSQRMCHTMSTPLCHKTSVTETIRKAPLANAQTALGKQKTRSVERRYLSNYQNSVKNCFFTQNFTEIGQSAAKLGPNTIFNVAAVCHRHKKAIFGHVTVIEFQICICAPNFIEIRWFLPRDAMQARSMSSCGVCLSACLSVCSSSSWILSKRTNISINFFHHRVAKPF